MTTIVLDAGHGGHDPGAQGHGLVEKNVALRIARGVRDGLQSKYDVDVRMTRDSDKFVELSERADIANRINADLFVSFHHNAAGGSGFETFVFPGTRRSKTGEMQDAIHDKLMAFYGPRGIRDRGKKEANFAVLRETDMPAVLIENLFLDHAGDAALLKQVNTIDSIIAASVMGIADALDLQPRAGSLPENSLPAIGGKGKVVAGGQEAEGFIIEDRLYVPVRFVSEALGARVSYDNQTKTATITK